jgi:23S rRNA (guanine2445-N2)-methyltransferase / 23S rRNA (guanine2069-N7)-methyltransferase
MDDVFDIQRDHVALLSNALNLLSPQGILYFSTNFKRFKLDGEALFKFNISDISADTVPEDFARHPKIHFCWRILKYA